MSESEEQTEKKKSPIVTIIVIVLLLAIGVIGFINMQKLQSVDDNVDMAEVSGIAEAVIETSEEKHEEVTHNEETHSESNESVEVTETASDVTSISTDFDLEKASKPRILGDVNAPIKISEHSSFTCGHCAKFHRTNFKDIKRDFIDTGKAYIIYTGFPLNGVDVNIGALARCVPEESYFDFIQLVFETQDTWRKSQDINASIRQHAKLAGASEAGLDKCADNDALFKAIAKQREDAMAKHDVKATPTLVINDSIVIPGLSPYSELKKVLDAEYEKASK